ncbi:MAG TPA: PA2169 family four-helix-bundle protein [Tepidisphaeraceae bacterium]|nr:PA2169 family four-helix-bundle protein [Tepidisphaeraceae bacterium]
MTTETINLRDTMNHLIEVCRDSEQLFSTAANAVAGEEPLLKAELTQYSFQRADFALDLERELIALGEEPVHGGTLSGAMHRGWMNIRHAVTSDNRNAILAECLRSENAVLEAYQSAQIADLPGPMPDMVQTQRAAIERVRDRIQSLRNAAELNHP